MPLDPPVTRAARPSITVLLSGSISRACGPGFYPSGGSRCTAAGARSLAYARRVGAWAAGRFVLAAILGGVALASCGGAKGGNGAAGPPPSGPVGPAPAFPKVGGRTPAQPRPGVGPGPPPSPPGAEA